MSAQKPDYAATIKERLEPLIKTGKRFLQDVQQGNIHSQQLLYISVVYLGIGGVINVLFPTFMLMFFGAGMSNSGATADITRFYGLVLCFLGLLAWGAQNGKYPTGETLKLFTFYYVATCILCMLIFIYGDLSFFILFNIVFDGALAYAHAKEAGFIKG